MMNAVYGRGCYGIELRAVWVAMWVTLSAVLPFRAAAYTFAPRIVTLRTAGGESSCFFRLENKEMKVAAVEIAIYGCRKDLDGKTLQGEAADEDFIIYPAQVILMPGDEVNVQVRWVGEASLDKERAYTIVAREVLLPRQEGAEPENDGAVRVRVNVLVNYEGRIYVTPRGAKPDIVLESASERRPSANANAGDDAVLEIVSANMGTAHKKMESVVFVLTPVDEAGVPATRQAITLTVADIPALKTHLLSGDRQRFVIPRPVGLPAGPFVASMNER